MLELDDFSSLLEIVIGFYGVYAIASKKILQTFLFSIIHGSLKNLVEESNEQLKKAKVKYDSIKKDESEIDKLKLSEAEKLHLSTCMMAAKQAYENASLLNDSYTFLVKNYKGQSYFPVLSIDMIALCIFLMVMGVLDYKIVWVTDYICFTMIILVALLQLHCYLFEFSSRIRNIKFLTPTVKSHLVIISLCVIGAFYIFNCKKWTLGHYSDINVYMSVFAILVVVPPIILLVWHYRLFIKPFKEWEKLLDRGMKLYHSDVIRYKEKQS